MREWNHTIRRLGMPVALGFALLVLAGLSMVALADADITRLDTNAGWELDPTVSQGRLAVQMGTIEIRGLGELTFDPSAITALRSDLFMPGHFSVFDVLVHLAERGDLELEYAFDDDLQTHVIQSLRGLSGWWYDAHYEGGGFDKTVVRMDQFPVKDNMNIVVYLEDPSRLDAINAHFRDEVARRASNEAVVVVPSIILQSSTMSTQFTDVTVTAHNTRPDVFQPGVLTMLDVLLSLGDQGQLDSLGIEWRDVDGDISVVDGYYIVSVQSEAFAPETTGSCVLTHQIQGDTIAEYLSPHTHTMSHIHLTADLEVLTSPEAVEWLWICL